MNARMMLALLEAFGIEELFGSDRLFDVGPIVED